MKLAEKRLRELVGELKLDWDLLVDHNGIYIYSS